MGCDAPVSNSLLSYLFCQINRDLYINSADSELIVSGFAIAVNSIS